MNLIPYKKIYQTVCGNPFSDSVSQFFEECYSKDFNSRLLPLNIENDDTAITITAEVPGVEKKDIKIDYQDGALTISAEKKEGVEKKEKNYLYREIAEGHFSRQIKVGSIDFEKAEGEYKDGILKLLLPKAENSKTKQLVLK